MLYDIFHLFILADKLGEEKCSAIPTEESTNVIHAAQPVNEMEVDTVSSNDRFVIVKRSDTERLLETIPKLVIYSCQNWKSLPLIIPTKGMSWTK
jgi:hypothetical protein